MIRTSQAWGITKSWILAKIRVWIWNFNIILEKVTDLSSLIPGGGAEVQKFLDTATEKQVSISEKRKEFVEKLKSIVESR